MNFQNKKMNKDKNNSMLSIVVLCHALKLKIPFLPNQIQSAIKLIPKNCFGVFVTVKRSKKHQLKTWPIDIHGCIGYWDEDFKPLSQKLLFEKCLDVGLSAMWNDSRRKYFSQEIWDDPNATIEIDFLKLPIHSINHKT